MNIGYSDEVIKKALGARVDNDCTVSDYLRGLLSQLWVQGGVFDAKRPFGALGWQWEVYRALIAAEVIPGRLDGDSFVEDFDIEAASKLVQQCITFVFANRPR